MNLTLLESSNWKDYELLDTGNGLKLERFGNYRLVRPEIQAMWKRGLPEAAWRDVHGVFQATSEESGGHWDLRKKVDQRWQMSYANLKFWAMTTPGRHLGVFPEVASHWDWLSRLIEQAGRPTKVLNLFGYTGLASLMAANAGAAVTHVDASKKSVAWARDNQVLSGLEAKPIRWIVDDALKFVQREGRRDAKYDGIILDPPKFGRGPKGEIWEVYKTLPDLLETCQTILADNPLFVVTTLYAVRASAVNLYQNLDEMMKGYGGKLEAGELVTRASSHSRLLSQAVYARWSDS